MKVLPAKVSIERGAAQPEHTEHGGPLSIVELTTAAACGRLRGTEVTASVGCRVDLCLST